MSIPNQAVRRRWGAVAGAAVGAAAVGAWCASETGAKPAVARLLSEELRSLGELAGVSGTPAEVQPRAPLPVYANQEGGPLWVGEVLAEVVEHDPAFEQAAGPHLLRTECVHEGRAYVVRMALFREGWNLRTPRARRIQVAPEVAIAAGVVAAAAVARRRRIAAGLFTAGLVAQLGAQLLPWPEPVATLGWLSAWREGTLGESVVAFARALPPGGVAVAFGFVVLALVLMIFDHRRSRGRGGMTLVWGIVGALGLLAWFEAALRVGLAGWGGTWAGVLALVATALVWLAALKLGRR